MTKKPDHEAYCLVCLGGGKTLGHYRKESDAWREVQSHQKITGHNGTVLKREAK